MMLVIQMESGNDDCWAIEGRVVTVCSCSGVGCGCMVAHLDVKEGVDGDHFAAHVVGPFEDLGSNVGEERVGGPPTEDHDLGCRDVVDEEGHSCSRPYRFVSYFVWAESEGGFASKGGAGGPQDFEDVGASNEAGFAFVSDGVDACGSGRSWYCPEDSLDLCPVSDDGAKVWVLGSALGS